LSAGKWCRVDPPGSTLRRERGRFQVIELRELTWLGFSAHAAPPCQDMADKVAKESAAEKKMSDLDKPAKC
jgi:hypothetical protein